ncbi:MAG: TRAP transporter small permease [Betaproteobacteria bacterium]|nr:MAG: TRAP transporter small permease [Betaproteobacteria bacterium]
MKATNASARYSAAGILRWGVSNSLEICAAAMLVMICVIVFAGVFFRYFLHIGLGWTEELSRYLQIWMTFVGATVAVKRWSHFQLTIVNQWIPAAAHTLTRVFGILVVMSLAGILIKNGIDITRVSWNQTSPIMSWNFGYLYIVVPISGVLMEMFAVRHLLAALKGAPPPPGIGHGDMTSRPASADGGLPSRAE